MKENPKSTNAPTITNIPLQLNSYLNNNKTQDILKPQKLQPSQQNIGQYEQFQDPTLLKLLLKMNQDLRDEFKQFQSLTQERISDLEMKHLNQQETIDYLLNLLQSSGVNVFNKQDLKDDSLKDSIQLRKLKLLGTQKNEKEAVDGIFKKCNQQDDNGSATLRSGQDDDEDEEQKNQTENLYYYSQEEMYKHNETSNYDEVRNRNVSEPDIVNRVEFEESGSFKNVDQSEDIKQQTIKSNILGSDQDEVQVQAINFDYQYMTNNQDDQSVMLVVHKSDINLDNDQSNDSNNSNNVEIVNNQQQDIVNLKDNSSSSLTNKIMVIDLQNQSYPSNKLVQQYSTFHNDKQNYVSGNSNNNTFNQYLQNNQSKFVEKPVNLIQSIESQESGNLKPQQHIQVELENNESNKSQKAQIFDQESDNNSQVNQVEEVQDQKIHSQSIDSSANYQQFNDDESVMQSMGSSPTYRNRESFNKANNNQANSQNQQQKSNSLYQQDLRLLNYVHTHQNNNMYDECQLEDSQIIYSPMILDEEECDIKDKTISSNHVPSSMIDQPPDLDLENAAVLFKNHDYSHNFDSAIDKTTFIGFTDHPHHMTGSGGVNTQQQVYSKTTMLLNTNNQMLTNTTAQQKSVFQYMQSNNNMQSQSRNKNQHIGLQQQQFYHQTENNLNMKGSFQSADKTSNKYYQNQNQQQQQLLQQKNQEILKSIAAHSNNNNQSIFNSEVVHLGKLNNRSRSQNGFSNIKRNGGGISNTFDIMPQSKFYFDQSHIQQQSFNHLFQSVIVKQVKSKLSKRRSQQYNLYTQGSGNSHQNISQQNSMQQYSRQQSQQCCQNQSSSKYNSNSINNQYFNYCCAISMQRSMDQTSPLTCDLRKFHDLHIVIEFLNNQQGRFQMQDILSKNLNISFQKELINDLAQQYTSQQQDYEEHYLITTSWWKDWCKYTNFVDNYFYIDTQAAYQTGIAPITKIPIKNFNDLVKGKRPDAIRNQQLLSFDMQHITSSEFIQVSFDIWTFLKSWYDADYKIKVSSLPSITQFGQLSQQVYNNSRQGISQKQQRTSSSINLYNGNQVKLISSQSNLNVNLMKSANQLIMDQAGHNNNINHQSIQRAQQNTNQQATNTFNKNMHHQQYLSKQLTVTTQNFMQNSEKTVFQVHPDEALSTPNYNKELINYDEQEEEEHKRSSSGKERYNNNGQHQNMLLQVNSVKQTMQTDRKSNNTLRNNI